MILAEITKDNKIQINDLQNPVGDGVLFETIKFTLIIFNKNPEIKAMA